MSLFYEELDYQKTAIGELVLRRRKSVSVADEFVYEVTIDGEMLMSSTVNDSELALARLALKALGDRQVDVLVGGLGLGCTAAGALEYPNVRKLTVVELLEPVISWHRERLVPLGCKLMDDSRCSLVAGDFFEHVSSPSSNHQYDAILLDIDHSPSSWLRERHKDFYNAAGLQGLANCLHPNGVFALWSAWKPETAFLDVLGEVFPSVQNHEIPFFNPHVNEMDSNWVVIAGGLD
ncbi:MAG TPA: spermidine synthase [Phycisphaerae bacterium]|nr:spermidine synthase [Phycisphaerae bacterium]